MTAVMLAATTAAARRALEWVGSKTLGNLVLGGDCEMEVTFKTDGTLDDTSLLGPNTTSWHNVAPKTGVGTGIYVRANTVSGVLDSLSSLSAGVWYQLTSDRVFGTMRLFAAGTGRDTWTGDFDLSYDGSTVAYNTGLITLNADTDSI